MLSLGQKFHVCLEIYLTYTKTDTDYNIHYTTSHFVLCKIAKFTDYIKQVHYCLTYFSLTTSPPSAPDISGAVKNSIHHVCRCRCIWRIIPCLHFCLAIEIFYLWHMYYFGLYPSSGCWDCF